MSKGIHSLEGVEPRDLYTTDGNDLWEVISTCAYPSVELRNVRTGDRTGGAVGSRHLATFIKEAGLTREHCELPTALSSALPPGVPMQSGGGNNALAFPALTPALSAVYNAYLTLQLETARLVDEHADLRALLLLLDANSRLQPPDSAARLRQPPVWKTEPLRLDATGLFPIP